MLATPLRPHLRCSAVALLLVTAAVAVSPPRRLAAQAVPAAPTLLPVLEGAQGLALGVDSATIRRSGDSTYVFYAVAAIQPAAGAPAAMHRMDHVELDCAQGRSRGWATLLYAGERAMEIDSLPAAWRVFDEQRLQVLRATCAVLLRTVADTTPLELHGGAADQRPQLLDAGRLPTTLQRHYPPDALREHVHGVAMLHFQVDTAGQVVPSTLSVLWSTPRFAAPALAVAGELRFQPARRHGRSVPVWLTVPLNFNPERPRARESFAAQYLAF